jgi:hypothetical protein
MFMSSTKMIPVVPMGGPNVPLRRLPASNDRVATPVDGHSRDASTL